MIDIGHGGTDTGAKGNGLVEKNLNLKVGLLLRDLFADYEVEVKTTRDTDITLTNDTRVEIVKNFDPDLCISIHHNSATSTDARGSEVIHAYYDQRDDKLANAILDNLSAIGMPKRRAFTKLNSRGDDWYFMIRRIWDSNTEAIIVEGGFVTNKTDADMLRKDEYLASEARAIGKAVVEYLGLRSKTENWWDADMKRIKAAGIIENEHDGNDTVTWAELATVMSRLLDKLKL